MRATVRPLLVFFGGYGATAADMQRWQAAAQSHPTYGHTFEFEAVPYPADADEAHAVQAGRDVAAGVIRRLGSRPHRNLVVVGHSSGAALAAAVAAGLGDSTVKLIILDTGIEIDGRPASGARLDKRAECWTATNGPLLSSHHRQTVNHCAHPRVLNTSACRTAVCLHFWLVNKNVPADLRFAQLKPADGRAVSLPYRQLDVNLAWLRDTPVAPEPKGRL